MHGGGDRRAVPHLDVVDALDQLLVVEERLLRDVVAGQHRDGLADRGLGLGAAHHPVALAGHDPPEAEEALVVDRADVALVAQGGEEGLHHPVVTVHQPQLAARVGPVDHDVLDARGDGDVERTRPVEVEGGGGGRRGALVVAAAPESSEEQAANAVANSRQTKSGGERRRRSDIGGGR